MTTVLEKVEFVEEIPAAWDRLSSEHYQQRMFLSHCQQYNPCRQRYYLLLSGGNLCAGAIVYTLRLDLLTYLGIKSPVTMQIVGVPCSVPSSGLVGEPAFQGELLRRLLRLEKGLLACLNLDNLPANVPAAVGRTWPDIVLTNTFPTWERYIAALAPRDVEVVLYDERVEPVPFDAPADLLAITVDSITARRAYAISDAFRARGVKVVLGGIHVTLVPEEAATHADAIVLGDAEPVWAQLLSDARLGHLRRTYQGPFDEVQKGIIPRRELFKGKGYLPVSLIQFSRGCPFHCSFCAVARLFRNTHHCRRVEEVVREIEEDQLRLLLFTDDNLTANRERARSLCTALKPLGIHWACQVSVDLVQDTELLELMAESGCMGQLIGFDSINPASLAWMQKSPNLREYDRYAKAIDILRKYGFQVWASFMLGNDHDSVECIEQTVRFAIESRFTLAFFHLLVPYPGTQLYAELERAGRLLFDGRWWLHPEFRYNTATFLPRHMTAQELGEIAVWANKEFYSARSIATRLFDPETNLRSMMKFLLYMRFNLLIRRTST